MPAALCPPGSPSVEQTVWSGEVGFQVDTPRAGDAPRDPRVLAPVLPGKASAVGTNSGVLGP